MTRRMRLITLLLEDRTAPAVFTVTTTEDNGNDNDPVAGSLRAAFKAANATPAIDDIEFAIPGSGVHSLTLAGRMPPLLAPIRINGYSQPGASPNSLVVGNDARLLIEIDVNGYGAFIFTQSNGDVTGTVIEGLSIVNASVPLEFASGVVNEVTIRGNFLGFRPDGTFAPGGEIYFAGGASFQGGANVRIGGPDVADRNVISVAGGTALYLHGLTTGLLVQNNYIGVNPAGTSMSAPSSAGRDGIRVLSGTGGRILDNVVSGNSVPISLTEGTEGYILQGNMVGTDATGTTAIPNTYGGVRVRGTNHLIGGDEPEAANVIAFNVGGGGVDVQIYSSGVTISRNSIYSNDGPGIELNGGVTGVGNNGQPAPTLTSVTSTAAGLMVTGKMTQAAVNGTFIIELFANPTGGDEGQAYLGTVTVTTDGSGTGLFTVAVPSFPAGFDAITATATSQATGDTSEFSTAVTASTSPPTIRSVLVGFPQFAVGEDLGGRAVQFYNPDRSLRFQAEPFPGFTGGLRTAVADFNADGIADLVVGTGPGTATRVRVLDGVDQRELFVIDPFEAAFTGGVYVSAGDVTGDGVADLVITPDEGGGPRVRVFNGAANFGQLIDFFGIDDPNFRGGARSAVGDMNGDGTGDLIVAAGFQGGPRVAGFDGTSLASGALVRLFGDFFAFEHSLRNGVFVAVGDIDGDGFAEVIAGGGPGGGPRVTAYSGKALLGNVYEERANFFAGDPENRGGVRLAVKDLDGDTQADLVTGAGTGAGSRTTAYLGKEIGPNGQPPAALDFDAFGGFTVGVFVG